MVPNQYWTPGALAPMGIMGKYYMHYGMDFLPPRRLGNACAARLVGELVMDNAGICRFHRAWAEEMIPDIVQELFGKKREYLDSLGLTGSRINSRNVSLFWESARSRDFVHTFLKRKRDVDNDADPVLAEWIARFDSDSLEAAREFWYEMRKGIDESLCEFA